ncbi:transporter [Priestia megaterium]|uniref:transporter n=1 Tax=Priestia megaterium TaxID=1404 RepID=UPI000BFAAE11|nr:transporter [Priestia megaterium]PFP20225.1 transporter [Priestia megaterium]PFU60815.1 transporter [Priestia megaterium]
MYPYQYDPRFQNLFPPGGGQGFPSFPPGGGQGFPPPPPGGGGQGFPPPPPGGGQGFPPPPPGGGGQGFPPQGGAQPPSSPPPAFTPTPKLGSGGPSLYAVDPGAISGCLYRYTYIWPRNGRPYWFYPTFVGRRSVAGYRWTGSFWVYAGVDVNQIREFQCV